MKEDKQVYDITIIGGTALQAYLQHFMAVCVKRA